MERKADQHERASCQSRNRVRKRDEKYSSVWRLWWRSEGTTEALMKFP
jgi:hypothetical protein